MNKTLCYAHCREAICQYSYSGFTEKEVQAIFTEIQRSADRGANCQSSGQVSIYLPLY